MSSFTASLTLTWLDMPGRYRQLDRALEFYYNEDIIVVPVGFVSDGASIPIFLRFIWSPWGAKWARAAIVHDYMTRFNIQDYKYSSMIFREACRVCKTDLVSRNLMYLAVYAAGWFRNTKFGQRIWNKTTKNYWLNDV